ncbi:MAG: ABC transporter substrate-binding protein [Azospirillum sp.]|nr:ABC transporter substrate-binding protein [Azospirillum sp.]MCA3265110.1 ABC transporter substrate-binding protein [Azospirillum sp.]
MIRRLAVSLALAAALSPFALSSAGAQQAPSGRLVLYTSQPQADAQATIDAFRRLHPGVEVTFTRDGTTQLMNRLQAEFVAGNPQPDVLLIADAMTMEALKRDNRLQAYPGARVDGLPQGGFDAEKTYFATKLITTGIVYNRAAPMKPESWADLLKPEARGQVIMPSPLFSGAAAIHMGAIVRQPGLGWAWFEGLKAGGAQAARGNPAVLEAVAGGQKLYGVIVDFMAIRARERGSPVEFVFPREGATFVTEPVAILRTARNVAAARAFVDFVLSPDGQTLAAQQGMLPALSEVRPPQGFPNLADVRLMPAPVADLLRSDERDKERFADLFGR